jgi:hypothetical protein
MSKWLGNAWNLLDFGIGVSYEMRYTVHMDSCSTRSNLSQLLTAAHELMLH